MAKTIDYEFKRGDTKLLKKFRPVDQNGNVLLLTNLDNIYFTMKKNENGTAIIKKNIGNGITYGVDGYYHITLQANETANLPAGTYKYDIELDTYNSQAQLIVSTIIEGEIELTQDVTQEGDRI